MTRSNLYILYGHKGVKANPSLELNHSEIVRKRIYFRNYVPCARGFL
jgi:hypothetical protein